MTQSARHRSVCLTELRKHTVHYRSMVLQNEDSSLTNFGLVWPHSPPLRGRQWFTEKSSQKWDLCFIGAVLKQYYFTFTREKSKNEDKKGGLANVRLVNSPISIKEQHSELFYGNIPHSGWDSPEQGLQKVSQKFQINYYGLTVN